jgi:hypothetical protein
MYAIKGKKKPKFINYDIFNMELKNTIYIMTNTIYQELEQPPLKNLNSGKDNKKSIF